MDLGLTGKTAFVAASSQGLGRAIAVRFVEEGANVTVSSRSREHVDEARRAVLDETAADEEQVLATTCDVTDRSEIDAAVDETVAAFGGLDVMVNNHGGPPAIPFDIADDDDWYQAFTTVIMSNVWLARAALPQLKSSETGSLITVTSASAREPGENHALSNVFRLGLYGLTKTIAVEHAPDVRANCVTPRFVMTDRIEYKVHRRADHRDISFEEALATRVDEVSLDRPGDPGEFGDAVAFLASPRASYITGSVLSVDGGWARSVF